MVSANEHYTMKRSYLSLANLTVVPDKLKINCILLFGYSWCSSSNTTTDKMYTLKPLAANHSPYLPTDATPICFKQTATAKKRTTTITTTGNNETHFYSGLIFTESTGFCKFNFICALTK